MRSGYPEILEESTQEQIAPLEVKKERLVSQGEYIGIPYYWETGINRNARDYLKGYIPTIREYSEYITEKETLTFGVKSNLAKLSSENLSNILNEQNHIHSKSIQNESQFFNWDPQKCQIFDTTFEGKQIFTCESWINWGVTPIDSFVLTNCFVNGEDGFCVFTDYLKSYYENKSSLDTRCASREEMELCNLEEYLSLVESN